MPLNGKGNKEIEKMKRGVLYAIAWDNVVILKYYVLYFLLGEWKNFSQFFYVRKDNSKKVAQIFAISVVCKEKKIPSHPYVVIFKRSNILKRASILCE